MNRSKKININDCFLEYLETVERILEDIVNGQDVSHTKMLSFKDATRKIKHCFEDTVEQEEALTVEESVAEYLKELGVPQHLGGYKYLIYAICYNYKNKVKFPRLSNMSAFFARYPQNMFALPKQFGKIKNE